MFSSVSGFLLTKYSLQLLTKLIYCYRTTADAHLEDVNDKHEGPARMDSAQEEQVMHEPNVEREGVVMILEGEEIRADSQYNIHNWMYNKVNIVLLLLLSVGSKVTSK